MLQIIADRIVYTILGLDPQSRWGAAVNFFVYDSVKIMLLLFGMIALIGFLRSYLPAEKLRQWLSSKKTSHLYASLFGALTPFCSCSSIPIFISFVRAGIPLGVTFSFLITSPLINEYLVVLMLGFFGLKITALYVVSGIAIGVISGSVLGAMKLEKYLEADLVDTSGKIDSRVYSGFFERVRFGFDEAVSIIKKLWLWVLAGVAVGALIHNYVPAEVIQSLIGKSGFWSVPLATLIGVPMYASCAAIVPVAVVLFQKGVPLGTAMAFMMAVSALSLPEAILLRRAMRLPLIGIFFAVTATAIIFTGYLFNLIH